MKNTVARELRAAGVIDVSAFENIGMPFELRDYQRLGLNRALSRDRFGLYLEPRLGKTIVFMLSALYCARYGVLSLLLAPPILQNQLKREWDSLEGNPYQCEAFNAGPAGRVKQMQGWRQRGVPPALLIMTKDIFLKEWQTLEQFGYRQVIWDECHMGLQNASSQIYRAVNWFISRPDNRLLLSTGTPIYTTATNCYPIISLTSPEAYANEAAFDRQHIIYRKVKVVMRNGKEILKEVPHKAKGLDLLHTHLYANAIRRTRLGTLNMRAPDVSVEDIILYPKHRQLYQDVINQKGLIVGTRAIDATSPSKLRHLAARIVMNPHAYSQPPIKQNAMLDAIDNITDRYPKGEKFILVVTYQETVEELQARYAKESPCVIYGGQTTAKSRAEADRFVTTESRLLILNADAGGVGLTLGHVCWSMIIVEPLSSYGKFDQVVSRMMLAGNTRPVSVYILRALGTLWMRAVELMLDRNAEIRVANNDMNDLLQELKGS